MKSSRSEKRELALYSAAEDKKFCMEHQVLYLSEVKALRKKGLEVTIISENFKSIKGLVVATIDWSNAFPNGIPVIVSAYLFGNLDHYPREHIKNQAQELYVIAYRAARRS